MQHRTIGYHGNDPSGLPVTGDVRVTDVAAWVYGRYLQADDAELEIIDRDTGRIVGGIYTYMRTGCRQWWAEEA